MKLSSQTLNKKLKNTEIKTPAYDHNNVDIGIVHLGPGAFHRAHQAVYTENIMNVDGGNWGICGVSLHSSTARDILAKQDYLYTLAVLDKKINYQVIGAIKEILVAQQQTAEVIARLSVTSTKLVTLTITEKGYCLNACGNLDLKHSDIAHDLNNPSKPISAIGFIVEGLKQRKLNNIPAFNVISCDNVSGNGDKLQQAVFDFANQLDASLAQWIKTEVAFPNTMVDSITPKTENYTIENVKHSTDIDDSWPIQREEFCQWVIENNWQGERPNWEKVGVIFTSDVNGFEKAKLRLLNCLHSTLAYAGTLMGYTSVYEVTSDEFFRKFITQMANTEIIGSFTPPKELNVKVYSNEIIKRFLNPEIRHLLSQIAWDGSQKLQMRILPIIHDNIALNRPTKLLCFSLACWFEFICRALKNGEEIIDPLADELAKMSILYSNNTNDIVDAFLNIESVFGLELKNNKRIKTQLVNSLHTLRIGRVNKINQVISALS